MCGWCCGGTPPEKRGEGHKGCSPNCHNAPRPARARRSSARTPQEQEDHADTRDEGWRDGRDHERRNVLAELAGDQPIGADLRAAVEAYIQRAATANTPPDLAAPAAAIDPVEPTTPIDVLGYIHTAWDCPCGEVNYVEGDATGETHECGVCPIRVTIKEAR